MTEKIIFTFSELAEFLGISVRGLYNEIEQGLPYFTIGKANGKRETRRFNIKKVLSWYEQREEMKK